MNMLFRRRVRVKGIKTRMYRSAAGLYFPDHSLVTPKHRNVLAVLRRPDGEGIIIPASNIVTNAGDIFYAQMAAGESPTNVFGVHEMCSAFASSTGDKTIDRADFTPIASSEKAHSSGYPTTDDADSDNTGAGVDIVTYLASYAGGDFNHAAITHGLITNATPGSAEPLLTGYAFASSFEKTAQDTLKVFVNHEMAGV